MENEHLAFFTDTAQWVLDGARSFEESCAEGPSPSVLYMLFAAPHEDEETVRGPPLLGTLPKSPLWVEKQIAAVEPRRAEASLPCSPTHFRLAV